jgi:hypothetical protein
VRAGCPKPEGDPTAGADERVVFDVAMRTGPTRSLWIRVGSTLLWAAYTGLYAIALLRQLEPLRAQYIR